MIAPDKGGALMEPQQMTGAEPMLGRLYALRVRNDAATPITASPTLWDL